LFFNGQLIPIFIGLARFVRTAGLLIIQSGLFG